MSKPRRRTASAAKYSAASVSAALNSPAVRSRTAKRLSAQIGADIEESADIVMVKAAVERGWLDERRVVLETLTGIARAGAGAGADMIITYHANDAAGWLRE